MEHIKLGPNLPPSSKLAFGCAGVLGRAGRTQSERALAAALESGITHFDVARSYGYGEAEACLGKAVRPRRESIVIATKFGIRPSAAAGGLRGLKPLARAFLTRFPGSRRLLHRTTAVQAVRGQFSVAGARQSFELSLRSLGVDYIDILFLHSPTLADITADLIEFLDDLIRQGKLRAYGVASSARTATAVRTAWPPITIAQFPGGLRHAVCNLASPITGPTITHGVFEGAATLLARVRSNGPDLSRLGLAGINESQLHQLLLGYALGANHSGPIICSMLGEGRVRENVATIEHPNFSRDQILEFAAWAAQSGWIAPQAESEPI